MNEIRKTDPARYNRILEINKGIEDYRNKYVSNPNSRLVDPNGIIIIPVVFHVLSSPNIAGSNIPDARILEQINILNADFSHTNIEQTPTPPAFVGAIANTQIRFELACFDPNGNSTNGITRTSLSNNSFNFNSDAMKQSATGHAPWDTKRYCNIWVCNLTGGAIGVTLAVGGVLANPDFDGIAVDESVVGITTSARFGLGRTVTHEMGHYLDVEHVFGTDENGCSDSDFCNDTPNQNAGNFNVPTFPRISCGNGPNGDMFMNFMDFTDDRVMNLFTNDQRTRMRAVFQPGMPRSGFIDNYFSMQNVYRSCTYNYFRVNTPFCQAQDNISWSVSGPATGGNTNRIFASFRNSSTANGVATVTASWGNFTASQSLQVGYGVESSFCTYNCGGYSSTYTESMRDGNAILTCPNTYINGELIYSGSNYPPGVSITLLNSSAPVYFSSNSNTFSLYFTQNFSDATIRAVIPTACGNKTVDYIFLARGSESPYYRISPNPASNNVVISAAMKKNGATEKIANDYQFEVQVFNPFGQMLASKKNVAGNPDVDIDISRFPSNQFYTVKLISGKDVQTQKFFKQ